jgi:phosphate transport system protein
MNEHILKRFDNELNKLRFRLVSMGTLVQQQIEYTIKAIINDNTDYAKVVLELEEKINSLDVKIEKQCVKIIALHQPVARDLRLILTGFQINIYLEIMGDMATNIITDFMEMLTPPELIEETKIPEMAAKIQLMINKLLDSFIDMDFELAMDAIRLGKEIDTMHKENFETLTNKMMYNYRIVQPCSYLLDVNRNFQILSRQTRSIAQELVYLFDAKVVKHKEIDQIIEKVSNTEESTNNQIANQE